MKLPKNTFATVTSANGTMLFCKDMSEEGAILLNDVSAQYISELDGWRIATALSKPVIEELKNQGMKHQSRTLSRKIKSVLDRHDEEALSKVVRKSRFSRNGVSATDSADLDFGDRCVILRIKDHIAIFTPERDNTVAAIAKDHGGLWVGKVGCWWFKFGDHKPTRTACKERWLTETERATAIQIATVQKAVAARLTEIEEKGARKPRKKPSSAESQRKYILGSLTEKLLNGDCQETKQTLLNALDAYVTRDSHRELFSSELAQV